MTDKMPERASRRQIRLYMLAVIILLVGLGSSIEIYVTAGEPADNSMVYEYEHSKRFRHEMEAVGGKANMLFSELASEAEALFEGRNLAYTVAFGTLVISIGLFCIARQTSGQTKSKPGD